MTTKLHALLLLCLPLGSLVAQPSLRITSPTAGTFVQPGEMLNVTVEVSPTQGVFQEVAIVGTTPIGTSKEARAQPPYQFTIQIPAGIRPGDCYITALGITLPGEFVYSKSVRLVVERADSPISIIVYPTAADFTMDQKRYFSVTGTYADRTEADLSQSSRIKYVSSAPGVATVNAVGIVTPVAPGSGTITISYDQLKLEVPLTVRPSRR